MFPCNPHKPHRLRRGAAAFVAGVVALAGLGVVAGAQPAAAGPTSLCDIVPERCQPQLPTFSVDPFGAVDTPTFGSAAVRVTGWASDINASGPIDVIVTIGGTLVSRSTALVYRPGVGSHGFDVTVPASPASAPVCVTGLNVGAGRDALIGCANFPYSTAFTPFDQCGVMSLPLTAVKWALTPPTGQTVVDVTTSSAGRVGFMSGPTSPTSLVGMSLSDGVMPGPLFRSAPMAALPPGTPGNPSGGINLVVPCPKRFTAAEVIAMSSALTSITPPAGVTITGALLLPGNDAVDLTLTGTFSAGLVSVPFVYTHSFTVTPSTNMNSTAEIVVATPTGPGTLVFTGAAGFLNLGWPQVLEPLMTVALAPVVQSGFNNFIATEAAKMGLPTGATLSAPRIVITPSGVSLTLAAGWFG
jgi:hypothetical protein